MNEIENETANENWLQSVSEVAKHFSLSISLSGWPAAATLISLQVLGIILYAIKAFVTQRA